MHAHAHQESRPLEEMRLGIQHPIVQTPLIRLVEEQVEVLERLSEPERLLRVLQIAKSAYTHSLRDISKTESHTLSSGAALVTSSIAL